MSLQRSKKRYKHGVLLYSTYANVCYVCAYCDRNSRRNEAPWEDGSTSTTVETNKLIFSLQPLLYCVHMQLCDTHLFSSPTTMFPISPAKTPRNVSPCSPR